MSGKGTAVLSLHLEGKGRSLPPERDKGWKSEKEEKIRGNSSRRLKVMSAGNKKNT